MGTRETVYTHPPEEALEEYALGRVRGLDLVQIEEHLLICGQCQDALAENDDFIAVMKRAAGALEKESPIEMLHRPRRKWFGRFGPRATPVYLGALAAAVLAVIVWMPRQPSAAYEAEATLQAMRGAQAGTPAVPAGKPFLLKADVTEIPFAAAYRLEIAASDGAIVWRGTAPRKDSALAVVVARKLPAGSYWVRLSDDNGTLQREYALESR
jgi:type II secretory pathway component PulM